MATFELEPRSRAANAIVPPVLGAYRRQYPDVELALQPGNSARLLETLRCGEIDLAFVGYQAPPLGLSSR